MTDFLKQIETGKKQKPRRVLFYGTHGVGKSTWASQAPDPIFIQTEEGLNDLDVSSFPLAGHFNDVIDQLTELYEKEHKFKTVIIDSLDWLERLIWECLCQSKNKENIEDFGYAKGYSYAMKFWERIKNGLDLIRNKAKMHVILIAHSKIENFKDPRSEPYDRYSPRLHKHASAFWQEWVDEVFFANFKANIVNPVEGDDKKKFEKARATGEGRRVVYTNERPAYLAKNRLGIKDNIDMTWEDYSSYFTTKKPTTKGDK